MKRRDDLDFEALADEAERGYDITPILEMFERAARIRHETVMPHRPWESLSAAEKELWIDAIKGAAVALTKARKARP